MIQAVLIALAVGALAYIAILYLFPKSMGGEERLHTRNALRQIMEQTETMSQASIASASILKDELEKLPLLRFIASLPGGEEAASLILKAGFGQKVPMLLAGWLVIFLALAMLSSMANLGALGTIGVLAVSVLLVRFYLKSRIQKRNDLFINLFPDVLDMIVRSVRSGFPLNAAVKMVAENMEPPVSTEFKQVQDELALGRPLDKALAGLAERIDEPDIHFFVVVLNVQHETGGNLAEIISNLSSIIRKRKQLRLRIRAMTSEGRATSWILGLLPVFVFIALYIMAPGHLEPLFTTPTGHMILGAASGLILLTFWIIRQMIDIDI